MKHCLLILVTACLACAGCFDNHSRPADVMTVTSLNDLAATNKAEIVRLFLRGAPRPVTDDDLKELSETGLKQLDLSEIKGQTVPESVWRLKGLTSFWFVRNGLVTIPDGIGNLPELTYLNLDGNSITNVSDSLAGAKKLRWLHLDGNAIANVPDSLVALKDMRRIFLRNNALTSVPAVVKEWPELEDLVLDGNKGLTDVPDWVCTSLPKLKSLSLCGCPVKRLPEDLSGLRNLNVLNLADCPLPSEEIERIRKALYEVREDKVVILF